MDQQLRTKKESGKGPVSQQSTPEEFHPSVSWTTNLTTHVLRIHLPGFKKEDLKVVVDGWGKLTVRGKKMITETKSIRLDQSFEVPKDSDVDKITGRYEDEYLTVVMPRKAMGGEDSWKSLPFDDKAREDDPASSKEKKGGEEKTKMPVGRKRRAAGEEELQEAAAFEQGLLDNLLEVLNRNKKVIAVAVAAFAVGFYVSERLRSRA